jgi:hypothetical protein
MVHANLNWTFGPLRYLLASPVFHRWHHTLEGEGLNKNFAPTFPFLDLIFGTFYMPPGKLPEQFGNGEPDFPEGFLGQLIYPLMKKKPQPEPIAIKVPLNHGGHGEQKPENSPQRTRRSQRKTQSFERKNQEIKQGLT